MLTSMGGGASSEIMGGDFADGFKVAFFTAAAAYAYAYSQGFNENGGKPHLLQNGKSDVGIRNDNASNIVNDTSTTMKTIGKIPTFDSMAEFHDGWTRDVSWLAKPGMLQVSIIPSIGLNLAATYSEYYNAFETTKFVRND